jgi:hypothetical protein
MGLKRDSGMLRSFEVDEELGTCLSHLLKLTKRKNRSILLLANDIDIPYFQNS